MICSGNKPNRELCPDSHDCWWLRFTLNNPLNTYILSVIDDKQQVSNLFKLSCLQLFAGKTQATQLKKTETHNQKNVDTRGWLNPYENDFAPAPRSSRARPRRAAPSRRISRRS